MKIATNKSGMIEVIVTNGNTSVIESILPSDALYFADVLKEMANVAIKHNPNDDNSSTPRTVG